MKYKLVAIDLDGTLLTDEHEISDKTKTILHQYKKAGGTIILCTGRGPSNTLPYMEELGMEGLVITHNGAVTVHSRDRERVYCSTFDINAVRPLIEYSRRGGLHFDLCTPFDMYTEIYGEAEKEMYDAFLLKPHVVEDAGKLNEKFVKFTFYGQPSQIARAWEDFRDSDLPLQFILSGDKFIDVMNPDVNKGTALRKAAEDLGVAREEVVAIGNYFNDMEMLQWAGVGVAMDNSPDELKKQADFVTKSNNEDGVCAALQKLLLIR